MTTKTKARTRTIGRVGTFGERLDAGHAALGHVLTNDLCRAPRPEDALHGALLSTIEAYGFASDEVVARAVRELGAIQLARIVSWKRGGSWTDNEHEADRIEGAWSAASDCHVAQALLAFLAHASAWKKNAHGRWYPLDARASEGALAALIDAVERAFGPRAMRTFVEVLVDRVTHDCDALKARDRAA